MSAIYKLSIQGVRSFDSNERETIEFGSPLTLIVGSNGTGKTTVIECLKYATTGDFPPNSKGGAFVHDPKIIGEKDIRAQVKLAFVSANGLNMIVTRNMQLLVKRSTQTFKTLEGQLVAINKAGDRTTLNTRSTDLDAQVPQYMGVPKAILDYVIFCHQEDSLWPLSEPANLKKKFDEIFQAMKFTKALDSLKAIKKDMNVDIKLLKQSVEHLKVDKDRANAIKLNISRLQEKNQEYQDQVKDIEVKIKKVTEESDILFKSNQDFQKVLSKLESLKRMEESTSEQIGRLKSSLEIIHLPKEELQNMLDNFSETLLQNERQIDEIVNHINSLKTQSNEIQTKCNQLIRRQGELKAQEGAHEQNIIQIESLKKIIFDNYGLADSNDNANYDIFLNTLLEYKNKLMENLNNITTTGHIEAERYNKLLTDIAKETMVESHKLEYGNNDILKLEDILQNLNNNLENINITEVEYEREKKDLQKFQDKLKDWENTNVIVDLTRQIKDKNMSLIDIENDLEKIQDQILKTNQKADLFAKLSFYKSILNEKNKNLNYLNEKLSSDLKVKSWDIDLENEPDLNFKKFYINLQKNIGLTTRDSNKLTKAVTEASLNLRNARQEYENYEKSISEITKQLEETLPEDCTIEDYDELLEEAEISYRTSLENLKMHQTTLAFNKKALEVAQNDDCCYLCSRKFEDATFRSKILDELILKTDAKFEISLKETVENEKEYLEILRSLEKDILSLKISKTKYNDINISLTKLETEENEAKKKLDDFEKSLTDLKSERDYAENTIRPIIESKLRLQNEIKRSEHDVSQISDELMIYGTSSGNVQTVDELKENQRLKNEQLKNTRKEINSLQEEKETKTSEYSNLLNLIKDRTYKIDSIEKHISQKERILEDINKKEKDKQNIKLSMEKAKAALKNLKERKKATEEKSLSITSNNENKIKQMQDELNSLTRYVDKFSDLAKQISIFTSSKDEMKHCTDELREYQAQLENLSKDIDIRSADLDRKKQTLNDSNNERKNLKQNIELLNLQFDINTIRREINELNLQNAEAERDKYQQESARLRSLFEQLSAENAGKIGEMKQLQNQITTLSQQLRVDYKHVNDKYHTEWVQLKTKLFVNDDIDTYSLALDTAIMKYHSLKMEDINTTIDELWKRTYSGTDVDSIKIRSDEVKSTQKGKSYNYRVVMYKQDAELDMRGRCSAGQKVLASIIIRLALSETFGINCGVIALDEPTTNLDEENIESLARSLHNIIQIRKNQKKFYTLIVITHDEKFLKHMDAAQFTDHFFKIKRDARQKSLIEWVDINKVVDE
ncbi:hypothetical protein TBLA_0A05720 [Henningerozyma blattae CBS 6284]|uniref:DNA repair protein RAD50 n=1 Tax=Henningerozyma blattae (strain ATCC 34711 / CBS 6284 / DSM 70876 / NBRC 10599 / NRRL Y-10934 / UCD 77-7) TaxID=1071380 RepID=I2GW63_HENB6|nr:hypothetical protein TBLA_0A05720 [Tetrapisispora blattae CBS 6284]CCH58365.1 hypothetical protein TBLA_0A05720 [Tetrapisispora blattae CBS 6284]